MFLEFFYSLRNYGIKVSLKEWLILMEALEKGLVKSNFLEFYYISRMIIVKSEADYDNFDLAFFTYFKEQLSENVLPEDILSYLENPVELQPYDEKEVLERTSLSFEDLEELFNQRLEEQIGAHNGGIKWIGTGGTSPFGNSGFSAIGIKAGDYKANSTALLLASKRLYSDFREDETINLRQFQVAFRKLKHLSSFHENAEKEFEIDTTIYETCKNGGIFKPVYGKPRKNGIKLMVLFDSGGSMEVYSNLCSRLFQSLSKANHFKDLKIYYFHNCPYNRIYKTPACDLSESLDTEWIFKNIPKEYKVIFVGDASMAPWEMRYFSGGRRGKVTDQTPGTLWLRRFAQTYKNVIWFNPIPKDEWEHTKGKETIKRIKAEIPMFHLSLKGIEEGIKNIISIRK